MGALAKEVPGLLKSVGEGVEKLATGAVGQAVGKGFNALVGGQSGKPIAFTMTGAAGETINVASDGTLTITNTDGTVSNFDKEGNPISNDYNFQPNDNLDDVNQEGQDSSQDYFENANQDVYDNYYDSFMDDYR